MGSAHKTQKAPKLSRKTLCSLLLSGTVNNGVVWMPGALSVAERGGGVGGTFIEDFPECFPRGFSRRSPKGFSDVSYRVLYGPLKGPKGFSDDTQGVL